MQRLQRGTEVEPAHDPYFVTLPGLAYLSQGASRIAGVTLSWSDDFVTRGHPASAAAEGSSCVAPEPGSGREVPTGRGEGWGRGARAPVIHTPFSRSPGYYSPSRLVPENLLRWYPTMWKTMPTGRSSLSRSKSSCHPELFHRDPRTCEIHTSIVAALLTRVLQSVTAATKRIPIPQAHASRPSRRRFPNCRRCDPILCGIPHMPVAALSPVLSSHAPLRHLLRPRSDRLPIHVPAQIPLQRPCRRRYPMARRLCFQGPGDTRQPKMQRPYRKENPCP